MRNRIKRINTADLIKYAVYFFLIIITVRGGTASGLRPFGLGVLAALVYARQNLIILAPMYVLANLTLGFSWQNFVIGITPCVLYAAGYFIYHKLGKRMSLTAVNILTLLAQAPYIGLNVKSLTPYEIVLTVVLAQIFAYIAILAFYAIVQRGLRYRLTVDENIAVYILAGVTALSLYDIGYQNFNLFYLFFGFFIMFAAHCLSTSAPVFFAVVAGLGCAFSGGGTEALTTAVILGTVAAVFRNVHPLATASAVIAADVFCAYYFNAYGGYGYVNLITLSAGALCFALLPKKFRIKGSLSDIGYARSGKSVVNKNRRELSLRLYSLAKIFEEMQVLLQGGGGVLPDVAVSRNHLAKDVAVSYCGKCENREACFSSLGSDTSGILEGVLEGSERRGKASIIDMPPFITGRCKRLNGLLSELNEKIDLQKKQSVEIVETDRGRQMLASQMGGVAEVLDKLADEYKRPVSFDGAREKLIIDELTYHNVDCKEVMVYGTDGNVLVTVLVSEADAEKAVLSAVVSKIMKVRLIKTSVNAVDSGYVSVQLSPAPAYDFVYGEATRTKNGESECGDVRCVRRVNAGKVIFAVGDGMGSGGAAESFGRRAVQMVENFFEAGFGNDVVINLSNRLLTLNRGDGYSAIDLMVLDLNTGAADFIKLGATYTVLKHGDSGEILEGPALPAGVLDNAKPYSVRKILINNDFVILMSDGVTDNIPVGELTEFLSAYRGTNPEAMASDIVKKAVEGGADDDVTCMVVRIFTRV